MDNDIEEQEAPILEDHDLYHHVIPLEHISELDPRRYVGQKRWGWILYTLQDVEGHTTPRGTFRESKRPQIYLGYSMLVSHISDSKPSSFEEVVGHQVWKDAMMDEYQSIMENDVWDIVPIPNVPPSFWDVGVWERGNARWGRVETTPKFQGNSGGAGGRRGHKSYKKYNNIINLGNNNSSYINIV